MGAPSVIMARFIGNYIIPIQLASIQFVPIHLVPIPLVQQVRLTRLALRPRGANLRRHCESLYL